MASQIGKTQGNRNMVFLAVIMGLGFLVRFHGISFGLPYLYHADEPIVVNHALAYGSGDLNPHFFRIPPLASYLLFAIYGFIYLAGYFSGLLSGVLEFERLFYSDPTLFYIVGRLVLGVIPGTLSIFILYQLVLAHFGGKAALISAFMFSLSFLHVRDSHYIYPDILLVLVLIASFFIIFRLSRAGGAIDGRAHLQAGFLIGLAAAVKYNGIFLIIPYITAVLFSGKATQSVVAIIKAGAVSFLVFFILNPYAILDFNFFLAEMRAENTAHNEGTSFFHHLTYGLLGSLGIPCLFMSFAGACLYLSPHFNREQATKIAVLSSFITAYYGILVLKGQHYDRYVLPMMPFLIILASIFISWMSSQQKWKNAVLIISVLIATAFPFAKTFLLMMIINKEDVRTQARTWVEENIPSGSVLGLGIPFYMPRLQQSESQLLKRQQELKGYVTFSEAQTRRLTFHLNKERHLKKGYNFYYLSDQPEMKHFLFSGPFVAYDFDHLKKLGVQYLILTGSLELKGKQNFRYKRDSGMERVATFSPYKTLQVDSPYDTYPLTGLPFTWQELYNRKTNGMPLVIYHLKETPKAA